MSIAAVVKSLKRSGLFGAQEEHEKTSTRYYSELFGPHIEPVRSIVQAVGKGLESNGIPCTLVAVGSSALSLVKRLTRVEKDKALGGVVRESGYSDINIRIAPHLERIRTRTLQDSLCETLDSYLMHMSLHSSSDDVAEIGYFVQDFSKGGREYVTSERGYGETIVTPYTNVISGAPSVTLGGIPRVSSVHNVPIEFTFGTSDRACTASLFMRELRAGTQPFAVLFSQES